MLPGVLIFACTYVIISARRLTWLRIDRPGGALLGAVACVATGVLSPKAALAAVDGRTLGLLFGMMGMGAFLAVDGFFERASRALAARARTKQRLLGGLVWSSGALSALVTNDALCVLAAPLVVALVRRHRLPALPFLIALATSANTGSVATLVGNPQNMLCAILGGLHYRNHLVLGVPIAIAGLALNHAFVALSFRSELAGPIEADASEREERLLSWTSGAALAVIGLSAVLFSLGADLAWTAVGGATVLLLLARVEAEQVWRRIDWSVLSFFAGLFVVVEGLVESGAPAWFFARMPLQTTVGPEGFGGWLRLAGIFLFGSNVVSNVPFILVVQREMSSLQNPMLGWELLAVASTFAGNLTLLGSVANIIVAEKGRELGGLGFWSYLRVGLPLSLATTALGATWIFVLR
jgi:Na+/H+ antiporter NhaD/arsenite permease-like protein